MMENNIKPRIRKIGDVWFCGTHWLYGNLYGDTPAQAFERWKKKDKETRDNMRIQQAYVDAMYRAQYGQQFMRASLFNTFGYD